MVFYSFCYNIAILGHQIPMFSNFSDFFKRFTYSKSGIHHTVTCIPRPLHNFSIAHTALLFLSALSTLHCNKNAMLFRYISSRPIMNMAKMCLKVLVYYECL
jgi:hypothetical protein